MLGHREDPRTDRRSDDALIHDTERVRQGPALLGGVIVGIALVIAVVLAVVQNDETVRFEWAVLDVDAPLWLLLVGAGAAGAALWVLGHAAVRHGRHRAARRRAAAEELGRRRGHHTARTFA